MDDGEVDDKEGRRLVGKGFRAGIALQQTVPHLAFTTFTNASNQHELRRGITWAGFWEAEDKGKLTDVSVVEVNRNGEL